jgi:spermidine synthase
MTGRLEPLLSGPEGLSDSAWFVEREGQEVAVSHRVREELFRGRTSFQEVALLRNSLYGTYLLLDGDFQSATRDEFIYHETIVHPAMIAHPEPRRVAILGGGEGATLREVLRHPSVQEAWLVDLDREVVEICRRYAPEYASGAFEDPRARLVFGDARDFLLGFEGHLDVVISDLTDPHPESPSRSLFSEAFFRLVRARLAEPGILSMQAGRGDFLYLAGHRRIREALARVFPKVTTMVASIPSFHANWAFATASTTLDPALLDAAEVAHRLQARGLTGLRHYDGVAHLGLLSPSKAVRAALQPEPSAR